jgi:hypothetical protein
MSDGRVLTSCTLYIRCFSCAVDDAEDLVLAHDDEFVAVELDLAARVFAEKNAVALLTSRAWRVPSSLYLPSPAAMTSPSCGFSFAVSG